MPVEFGFKSLDAKIVIKVHAFTADRVTGHTQINGIT